MGVPHQHQAAAPGEGLQQGLHQHHIHHGGLVQDHRVGVQGLPLVVGEGEAAGVAVVPGFQEAVDGGGLRPAGLCQALGCPPGGGGEGRAQPQVVKEGQDPPEGGGLAGAWPPGEEHHLLPGGGFHRLHLEGGVGEALVPLDLHQQLLQVVWGAELPPVHGQQGVGHIGLTVVELV